MSDYYRERLHTKEEQLRIANDLIDFKNKGLQKQTRRIEKLEEENKKLKEEVECLEGVIQDEEDWKAIEQEYEEWSDDNDTYS